VSELLVLNFNFHVEHHLFPSLPWYRLRKARRLVTAALAASYQECIGISWNLGNRTRSIDTIIERYRQSEGSEAS
jgi:acyl-lipid omega-6 desaturase (Delta-12 desaturase)